jgi:S-adenosylmethionine hydrolase
MGNRPTMPIITLTTDFGARDYYLGAVKGVLLSLAPEARLVDLTHEVPPQDVLEAAFVLRHACCEFPPGTVHLAVVDPGVGTARRALAVRSSGYLYVGPDNGLFSFALEAPGAQARQLAHPDLRKEPLSRTFHGRDLFAPAAALLCSGFPFAETGPLVADPVLLPEARPRSSADRLQGQVIHIDRFGNLVTNIAAADLEPWLPGLRILLGADTQLQRVCHTYAEAAPGELLALIGSAGLLEISLNGGSAARALGLDRRAPVVVERA